MLRTSYYSLLHEIIFCPVNIFFLSKYLRTLDGNFTSVAHLKIKKKTSQKLFYCWNYFIHGPRVYVGKVCYAPYNY